VSVWCLPSQKKAARSLRLNSVAVQAGVRGVPRSVSLHEQLFLCYLEVGAVLMAGSPPPLWARAHSPQADLGSASP
jgi:hypothetical protein